MENKELLLKDLCARLPYGVKGLHRGQVHELFTIDGRDANNACIQVDGYDAWFNIDTTPIKLYLRPISSMTEDELKDLNEKYGDIAYFFIQEQPYYHGLQAQHSDIGSIEISEFSEIYDWLNEHHFDYRGLIEKSLAIVAPEGMYKTE